VGFVFASLMSGAKNFVPEPKVDGSVVYVEPMITPVASVDLQALEEFCRFGFSAKRKVLHFQAGLIL
jgi:16S rRNA A1518/A1519 N6-dimethyltransferase RsmA/KsgA/DIM1 with predicted DNA glycosylase/AP lyase activity